MNVRIGRLVKSSNITIPFLFSIIPINIPIKSIRNQQNKK